MLLFLAVFLILLNKITLLLHVKILSKTLSPDLINLYNDKSHHNNGKKKKIYIYIYKNKMIKSLPEMSNTNAQFRLNERTFHLAICCKDGSIKWI